MPHWPDSKVVNYHHPPPGRPTYHETHIIWTILDLFQPMSLINHLAVRYTRDLSEFRATISSRIPPPMPPGTLSATDFTVLSVAFSLSALSFVKALLREEPLPRAGQHHGQRSRRPLKLLARHLGVHVRGGRLRDGLLNGRLRGGLERPTLRQEPGHGRQQERQQVERRPWGPPGARWLRRCLGLGLSLERKWEERRESTPCPWKHLRQAKVCKPYKILGPHGIGLQPRAGVHCVIPCGSIGWLSLIPATKAPFKSHGLARVQAPSSIRSAHSPLTAGPKVTSKAPRP